MSRGLRSRGKAAVGFGLRARRAILTSVDRFAAGQPRVSFPPRARPSCLWQEDAARAARGSFGDSRCEVSACPKTMPSQFGSDSSILTPGCNMNRGRFGSERLRIL